MDQPEGLKQLADRVRRDLAWLDFPANDWVHGRETRAGEAILDVLIIGGGQSGLGVAAGLMRERVRNVLVLDRNPAGCEGPWVTFARMKTLRTPKHLVGLDLGIPNLTFRAWYEAQRGEGSWEALGLIPKEMWARYLGWYRDLLEVPVRNGVEAGAVRWDEDERCFAVPTREVTWDEGERCFLPQDATRGAATTLYARKVVLATGIDGSGYWRVPAMLSEALPERLYAHTRQRIDFKALRGKRIGVLGAGASAFDNASVALEEGAASVDLFFRRASLPNVNPYRWAEFTGYLQHHADLPDADRWRFILQILRMGQLPPTDTFERATQHAGFRMHASSSWDHVEALGDEAVRVLTPGGTHTFDFVIAGTGFITDLGARPELTEVEQHITRWGDRFEPPPGQEHADLLRHPYLGPHFEFLPRQPEQAPWLTSLFNYTFGGLVSMGFGGASISGMKYSLPRIVRGITGQIYTEDREAYFDSLASFDLREF